MGTATYGVHAVATADGRVGVVALNTAGAAYNFAGLSAGAVAVNERIILQAQFNGTQARARKRSGGVTGSWTSLASFEINAGNATAGTTLLDKGALGTAFQGEFGGAFLEQQYATDMDDVLASFAAEVGLP